MSSLYLHIPFCRRRCIYCDFYSSVRTGWRERYVSALCLELECRRGYLVDPVRTVYFGGGTPSLLSIAQLGRIFGVIDRVWGMGSVEEVTMEANPDDLSREYVEALRRDLPFNRLSIGIQTFDDVRLRRLGRRHSAEQAVRAVERSRQAGFGNVSIDLIYGLPGESLEDWRRDLDVAVGLGVEHISAYHLTFEEGTVLYGLLRRGRVRKPEEELSVAMSELLEDCLAAAGYVHYEVSNFCLPGCHSRHNWSYWDGSSYVGVGASAHSYDGRSREWNVASLSEYVEGMERGCRCMEREVLTVDMRYNERVLTALRTCVGLDLGGVRRDFGRERAEYCLRMADRYLRGGELVLEGDCLRLSRRGLLVADGVIAELMAV